MTQDSFSFTLLDGRTLVGYPKNGSRFSVDDTHSSRSSQCVTPTAATDGYAEYGKVSHIFVLEPQQIEEAPSQLTMEERKRHETQQKQLFRSNIPLFLANQEQILSDSRLFLTPIPMRSNLAHIGTDSLRCPTLGVFLEWLRCCPQAIQTDRRHHTWVICHICGSPLSGANHCTWVNENGTTKTAAIYPFLPVWQSFSKVNTRYDAAKTTCQAYTLQQAITLLGGTLKKEETNPNQP